MKVEKSVYNYSTEAVITTPYRSNPDHLQKPPERGREREMEKRAAFAAEPVYHFVTDFPIIILQQLDPISIRIYNATRAAMRPPRKATGPIVDAAFGVLVADADAVAPVAAAVVCEAVADDVELALLQTTWSGTVTPAPVQMSFAYLTAVSWSA